MDIMSTIWFAELAHIETTQGTGPCMYIHIAIKNAFTGLFYHENVCFATILSPRLL